MRLTVPILVEEIRPPGEPWRSEHRLEPLFFAGLGETDTSLSRGLGDLKRLLERHLRELARAGDHATAAAYGYFPDVTIESFALRIDLRRGPLRLVVPVVMFPRWSRLLAFLPDARDVWFQLEPEGDHELRVGDVLNHTFREFERKLDRADVDALLERFERPRRRLSIVPLAVEFEAKQLLERSDREPRAAVVPEQTFHGASELWAVGRNLETLYPDRLDRSFGREELISELQRLLALPDRRPLALVGPRLVGKTAAVHEVLHRRAEAEAGGEQPPRQGTEEFWTLSPQRLIAGMSHLGQWEQRLLAILGFLEQRRHVLVVDDILGLYSLGQSAGSDLCVADVLRPWIQARRIRVLAQLTPEQQRRLTERDRGLADAFHVVRLAEPSPDETLEILLESVSLLEQRHGGRFAPDAVAAVLRLTGRHQRGLAFPGKAIRLLTDLAIRHPAPRRVLAIDPWIAASSTARGGWGHDPAAEAAAPWIDRKAVLQDFEERSGLAGAFVDEEARLPRDEVVASLRRLLVGQDAAVEALADVIATAKAGLNDPERPLGSLLLVGPTGVGKTQAAKALAAVLFGDPARLLRFDMNEYASAEAAARLVGSLFRPEGLLTGAVRRQPFCVILLDEIEKAHPDVFDLLLQVLGEARLTDAAGLTTDFSSAVILLTSNLGSREAARGLGFGGEEAATTGVYRRAVEQFFRPEFVNRLDHVVMFGELAHEQLAEIAKRLLAEVLAREGLARRRCMLEVSPAALEWVVARGSDRALGARAMKRAVERHLVQPVARQLAATTPELPTVISIGTHPQTGVAVQVVGLEQALPPPSLLDIAAIGSEDFARRVAAVLDRLTARCQRHRPATPASFRSVPADYAWHLGVTEQIRDLRQEWKEAGDGPRESDGWPASPQPLAAGLRASVPPVTFSWKGAPQFRDHVRELAAAIDIRDYFRELAAAAAPQPVRDRGSFLRGMLGRLDLLGPGEDGWRIEQALVIVRSPADHASERAAVLERISAALTLPQVGFDVRWHRGEAATGLASAGSTDAACPWWDLVPDEAARRRFREVMILDVAVISGHHASGFAARLAGSRLVGTSDGRLLPFLVADVPVSSARSPGEALAECLTAHEAAAAADVGTAADPLRWRPVVEIVAADGFRPLSWDDFLPLPPEFAE